jgi:hypothetical protein
VEHDRIGEPCAREHYDQVDAMPHGDAPHFGIECRRRQHTVTAADMVAVAIEVPHGPVVDALIDWGFVVYAINPKRYRLRDRFSVAGANDDRRDAYVQADGPRTDGRLFSAFRLLIHGSSNCVRGRGTPRNCGRNGFG